MKKSNGFFLLVLSLIVAILFASLTSATIGSIFPIITPNADSTSSFIISFVAGSIEKEVNVKITLYHPIETRELPSDAPYFSTAGIYNPVPKVYQLNLSPAMILKENTPPRVAGVINGVSVLSYDTTFSSSPNLDQTQQIRIVTRVPYSIPIVIEARTRETSASSWSTSTFYRSFTQPPGQSTPIKTPFALTPLPTSDLPKFKAFLSNIAHLQNAGGLEKAVGIRFSTPLNVATIDQVFALDVFGAHTALTDGAQIKINTDSTDLPFPFPRISFLAPLPQDLTGLEIHFTLLSTPMTVDVISASLYFIDPATGLIYDDTLRLSTDLSSTTYSSLSPNQYCVTLDKVSKVTTPLYLLKDGKTNHQEYDYTFTIKKTDTSSPTTNWGLVIPQSMVEVMRFVQCRIWSESNSATMTISVLDSTSSLSGGTITWNTETSVKITCTAIFSPNLTWVSSKSPRHSKTLPEYSAIGPHDFYNVVMFTQTSLGAMCSNPPWFKTLGSISDLDPEKTNLPPDWLILDPKSSSEITIRPLHYGTGSNHRTNWKAVITTPGISSPIPLAFRVDSQFYTQFQFSTRFPTWTEPTGATETPEIIPYTDLSSTSDGAFGYFQADFPYSLGIPFDYYSVETLYFFDIEYELGIIIRYPTGSDPTVSGNDCLYQTVQNPNVSSLYDFAVNLKPDPFTSTNHVLKVPPAYLPQIGMISDIDGSYDFQSESFIAEIQILSIPLNFDQKPASRNIESCWDLFPNFIIYPDTTIEFTLFGENRDLFKFDGDNISVPHNNNALWSATQFNDYIIRIKYLGKQFWEVSPSDQQVFNVPIQFNSANLDLTTDLSLTTNIWIGDGLATAVTLPPSDKNTITFTRPVDGSSYLDSGLLVSLVSPSLPTFKITELLTKHLWTSEGQSTPNWIITVDYTVEFNGVNTLPAGVGIQSVDLYYYKQLLNNKFDTIPTFLKNLPRDSTTTTTIITTKLNTNELYDRAFIQISFQDINNAQNPDIVTVTPWFKILPACQKIDGSGIVSSTCQTMAVCHPLGYCQGSQPAPINPICQACNGLSTISCDSLAVEPKCICQDGMTGPTCSEPEECTLVSTRNCQKNNGFVQLVNGQCSNTCVCYNAWAGRRCDNCTFQCLNSGKLYKSCNGCACSEGFSGKNCQCNSVTGSITINASNDLVISTEGKLDIGTASQISGMIDSKGKLVFSQTLVNLEQIDYLPATLQMYQFAFASLVKDVFIGFQEPLLEIENSPFYLTISPKADDPQRTTFDFIIPFGCPESNAHFTSIDKLTAQWTKFTAGFTQLDVIQKYFTFPDSPEPTTQTPLTPTPEQPPPDDDDDDDDGEPVEPASGFANGFFMALIGGIMVGLFF